MASLLEPREVAIDQLDSLLHLVIVALDMAARHEVLLRAEMLEHTAALEYLRDAERGDLERTHSIDAPALERDRALRDLAAFGAQQAGDGSERRCLPRSVRAQQRRNRTFSNGEGHALQDEDDPVVNDLDVIDRQHRPTPKFRRSVQAVPPPAPRPLSSGP